MIKRSYSSHPDFDKIVQAYRDRYGVDLSHMRMKWSKHPVYNDGRRSYELDDDEAGGSWVRDGTVRINPKMGPVMKRFGIDGMTQAEFRRRLIAHELAHEVWFKQNRKAKVKNLNLNFHIIPTICLVLNVRILIILQKMSVWKNVI